MVSEQIMLVVFTAIVIILLILDLFVLHRKSEDMRIHVALMWSAFWISLAMIFNVIIYFMYGSEKALNFLTGYLIEESLSVDNLFVFLIIFKYFGVSSRYQRKVLFWGILGALIMRAIFIATGISLISRFHWIIYVFGAFLIYTGFKMFNSKDEDVHPEKNIFLRLFTRFLPVTKQYHEDKFIVRLENRFLATPLLVVLIVVETTDVIFALDSIPAILAITTDPFIVYTSNICAILGLRALYFALAGVMNLFHYLNYGLAMILTFVGLKMLISDYYHIHVGYALATIAVILAVSIIASILFPDKRKLATEDVTRTDRDTKV